MVTWRGHGVGRRQTVPCINTVGQDLAQGYMVTSILMALDTIRDRDMALFCKYLIFDSYQTEEEKITMDRKMPETKNV